MEQNEKYGIVLVAETSYFKRGLKELLNYTKAFGQGMKESFVEQSKQMADEFKNQFAKLNINKVIEKNGKTFKVEIDPELDIDKLREASDNYEKLLEQLKERKGTATTEEETITYDKDIEMYEVKLQAINDRIKEIESSEEELNEELQKTSRTSKNINLESLFDRSIGKIKRFTFYLLGARSVFSLFMKYQSIYYQYNEQMQYQSELSQNAIALSLAPAFEFLGTVITYASIAFAKFIELLTGVNVLSKVSTKGIRDYNKSLKETQTLVSGIDEITNLTNPQNLGLASQYKALEEFQKKVAEVSKWFDNNPWVTDLANGLKDIVNYISQHWDIFKYIIGGALLVNFLGFPVNGGFGFFTTLIGLLGGIAISAKKAKDEIDKLKQNSKEESKSKLDKWPDVFKVIIERLGKTKKGTKEWDKETLNLKEAINGVASTIKNGKFSYEEYLPVIEEISKQLNRLDEEDFKAEIDLFMDIQKAKADYNTLYDYVKTKGLHANMNITLTDVVKNNVSNTQNKSTIADFFGFGTKDTTNKDKVNAFWEVVFGHKLFAKGLDYVPYDNFPAILHKGEAVVPAKYNPTIHNEGNEYTNSLLETLISKVDDLANRPNEFNIDGQKLAKATYPLIRAEARNYTYNEGVSR